MIFLYFISLVIESISFKR